MTDCLWVIGTFTQTHTKPICFPADIDLLMEMIIIGVPNTI